MNKNLRKGSFDVLPLSILPLRRLGKIQSITKYLWILTNKKPSQGWF